MRNVVVFLIGTIVIFGCKTADVVPTVTVAEQLAIDIELIDTYLADNGITDVIIHPTGIRYTINKVGSGPKVKITDVVWLTYEGRFLNRSDFFDKGQFGPQVFNAAWPVIEGWYHMVLEMSEGDEYTAYFPSKYGYGVNGTQTGSIEPNTVIVFDMTLDKIGN